MYNKYGHIVKAILFCLIFAEIFGCLQQIVMPKWYYPDETLPEATSRIVTGFYEEDDPIDVLILGPSTSLYGISPMELYERYGYSAYNLSSSAQCIQISYYLLKEALKYQRPQVVIYEVSPLYYPVKTEEARWRYVLDQMSFSRNKLEMAETYVNYCSEDVSLADAVIPFLRYHENWENLSSNNFNDWHRNRNFYAKGYYLNSMQLSTNVSTSEVDELVSRMLMDNQAVTYEYVEGESKIIQKDNSIYNTSPDTENINWLVEMQKLCDENNISFLTIHIPRYRLPQDAAAWSRQRYMEMKDVCNRYGITYWDMSYDAEIPIDTNTDTTDGGQHLNILGAIKATDALGRYLSNNYELEQRENDNWNNDLRTYNTIKAVALLETETDFQNYIIKLKEEFSDKVIFVAASDDMSAGLNQGDIEVLNELGLKTDFKSDAFRKSYVAVIENGVVVYEALSNREINYCGRLKERLTSFELVSAGWYPTRAQARILIDGVNYAQSYRGFNIVVYDDDRDIVIDTVSFDTCSEEHTVMRNSSDQRKQLSEFENYIIENEAR